MLFVVRLVWILVIIAFMQGTIGIAFVSTSLYANHSSFLNTLFIIPHVMLYILGGEFVSLFIDNVISTRINIVRHYVVGKKMMTLFI